MHCVLYKGEKSYLEKNKGGKIRTLANGGKGFTIDNLTIAISLS